MVLYGYTVVKGVKLDKKSKSTDRNLSLCVFYDENESKVSIGMSIKHPKDRFERKKGRFIAEGRAMKSPYKVITGVASEMTKRELLNTYLYSELENFEKNPEYLKSLIQKK